MLKYKNSEDCNPFPTRAAKFFLVVSSSFFLPSNNALQSLRWIRNIAVLSAGYSLFTNKWETTEKIADIYFWTFFQVAAPYFLIHEMGHLITARTLFSNSGAKIAKLIPFKEAMHTYTPSYGVRPLWKNVSSDTAQMMVWMGGMIASLTYAIAVRNLFPSSALAQSTLELAYGAGVFFDEKSNPTHDLAALQFQYGIPAAISILPAVMTTMYLAYRYLTIQEQTASSAP